MQHINFFFNRYLTKFQELLDLYFMKKLFWPPRMVIETIVRRMRSAIWSNILLNVPKLIRK
ncbi:hypothetical protein QTP88_001098 [Uroleucon formosanum]